MEMLYANPALKILCYGPVPAAAGPVSFGVFGIVPCAQARVTPVVYLHSRAHADPRTPTFQHVLNSLDHRGPAHALRIADSTSLADAVAFLDALLCETPAVLVLHDALHSAHDAQPLQFLLVAPGEVTRKHITSTPFTTHSFAAQIRE